MANEPTIGDWYQEPESGDTFEVIGIGADGAIHANYLDLGDRRLDQEEWRRISPVRVQAPQTGPRDNARAPSAPPPRERG